MTNALTSAKGEKMTIIRVTLRRADTVVNSATLPTWAAAWAQARRWGFRKGDSGVSKWLVSGDLWRLDCEM